MRLIKTVLKRLFQFILIALIGLLSWMYISDATLTNRIISNLILGNDGPLEIVQAKGYEPIPAGTAEEAGIAQSAIDAAIAYGAETDSQALLIYRGGKLVTEHYYEGFDASSVANTASMHKSVLGILVGVAIDQGLIESVDDPVAKYIPEWAEDDRKNITIKQLLRQTSGIDFPSFGFNLTGNFFQFFLGDDVAGVTFKQQVWVEPDIRFDYNNLGPQILGIMLQRLSGQRYAEYLSENIWQHIGVDEATVQVDQPDGMARTFCCINATARSWLKVGLLHLNKGRVGDKQVVPEAWMNEMVVPGKHEPNYGYLTWLGTEYKEQQTYNRKGSTAVPHSEPYLVDDLIYFDGFGGQRVYISPSKELVIVRTGSMILDWDDSILPNTVLRGIN